MPRWYFIPRKALTSTFSVKVAMPIKLAMQIADWGVG
jgi:hypothetical protein